MQNTFIRKYTSKAGAGLFLVIISLGMLFFLWLMFSSDNVNEPAKDIRYLFILIISIVLIIYGIAFDFLTRCYLCSDGVITKRLFILKKQNSFNFSDVVEIRRYILHFDRYYWGVSKTMLNAIAKHRWNGIEIVTKFKTDKPIYIPINIKNLDQLVYEITLRCPQAKVSNEVEKRLYDWQRSYPKQYEEVINRVKGVEATV